MLCCTAAIKEAHAFSMKATYQNPASFVRHTIPKIFQISYKSATITFTFPSLCLEWRVENTYPPYIKNSTVTQTWLLPFPRLLMIPTYLLKLYGYLGLNTTQYDTISQPKPNRGNKLCVGTEYSNFHPVLRIWWPQLSIINQARFNFKSFNPAQTCTVQTQAFL